MTSTGGELDNMLIEKLVDLCFEVKNHAFCKYSQFPVGAALLAADGTIYTGCNVENGSYELTICAEKTAIVKAISEGRTQFKAIFIASNLSNSYIVPCGGCRQFLTEFGLDWDVYMTKPDRTYIKMSVKQLLPPYNLADNQQLPPLVEDPCTTDCSRKGNLLPSINES